MKVPGLLPFLLAAGCDRILILDDLNDALSPKHEVTVETPTPWKIGGRAPVRIRLSEPGVETPVRGKVEVLLDGREIATSWVDESGYADLAVPVPDAEGSHRLTIWSKTRFNTRRDPLAIALQPGHSIFFSLDRPLAQPGQEIHLRALVLKSDRTPDAGRPVTFEILDPSGNRVLRETMIAGEFGIAHATLKLADEVLLGGYTAAAKAGSVAAERPFWVKRYALPRFRIDLVPEQTFALPGEPVRGLVNASYVFGNPIADAHVTLHVEVFDGEAREIRRDEHRLDRAGRAAFAFDAPERGTLLRLTAEVTDGAGHRESSSMVLPLSTSPLLIHAAPAGRQIAPGVDNEITVLVLAADGRPVEAEVTAAGRSTRTSARGSAILKVQEPHLTIVARDGAGHVAHRSFDFPPGPPLAIHPARRAPRAGADLPVEVRSSRDGRYRIDLRTDRGIVASREVDVTQGRGSISFALPAGLDGLAALECAGASTLVWVRGDRRLDVQVRPGRPTVEPGEEVSLRFEVRDGRGNPARAAIGVTIVDEALRGLAEMDPEGDLASFAVGRWAQGHAARTLWNGEDDEACDVAAAILLAGRQLEGSVARFDSRRTP